MTLSPRQAQALAAIDRSVCERQRPPTRRELLAALGISPRSLNFMIQVMTRLEAKGFIRWERHAARGITIIKRRDGDRFLIDGQWYELERI